MDLDRLIKIQNDLAKRLVLEDEFEEIKRIAGADLGYRSEDAFCAIVVLDYRTLEVVERTAIKAGVNFPYIPTFLAFREIGPIREALKDLETKQDILLIDGHGIAHPRRMGIASHLGVLLDIPTIGVAKRLLCGEVEGKMELRKPLPIIFNRKQVGWAVKTKKGTNPIYISPGHRVSLKSSLEIVLHCIKRHKLPEPSRLAHEEAMNARSRGSFYQARLSR
ncbi:MAG: deoxyribonuclease V [Candidatus Hydrothermarchaeales archaeon]